MYVSSSKQVFSVLCSVQQSKGAGKEELPREDGGGGGHHEEERVRLGTAAGWHESHQ